MKKIIFKALLIMSFFTSTSSHAQGFIYVNLITTYGNIQLQLNPEKAPLTVNNFLRYIKAGRYNGTIIHRVIPGFIIQGGGYNESIKPIPTFPAIVNESSNGLRNMALTIAMARTADPHSATSQFFINLSSNFFLDAEKGKKGYTVFGKVLDGMNTVESIASVRTGQYKLMGNVPQFPIVITKAEVIK